MTSDSNEEDDRTVYQPKKADAQQKPKSGKEQKDPASPEKEAGPQSEDNAAEPEATRFEKPSPSPSPSPGAGHEPTRFEKPASPAPDQPARTRFEAKEPSSQAPAPDLNTPATPPPPRPKAKSGSKRQFEDGEVLNGIYRITRFLARGGMGEVYEATNIHQQQERVAIKVMLPHMAQDELVAAMFSQEAEMLTRLHHEAIVPYRMTARDAQGKPYIVTEFVDGPSLEQKLGKLQLSDQAFARLAQKLAAGLGTAHNLGAIHRDIAPDNILLADGDPARPKIIDFGIAKDARENSGTIVGDGFAGKLKYVAPEQLGEYDRNVGPWTDLYSLALTLRAVAAGKHSEMGGSLADAVRKRQEVPDVSDIPERYRAAFEMALQPDPSLRPQSMAEFILRLGEPFGEGTGLTIGEGGRADDPADKSRANQEKGKTEKAKPKKTKAAKQEKAKKEESNRPAVSLAALSNLAGNRLALIGGGVAAVLLIVVTAVVLLSSGGSPEKPSPSSSGKPTGSNPSVPAAAGSSPRDIDNPQFAQLAKRAIGGVDCAWLAYGGANEGLARFVGGAANPAAAQTSLVKALEQGGSGAFSIDMGDVVRFKQQDCAAIDAMLSARSTVPLISTPQNNYEVEQQEVSRDDGAVIAEENQFAKVEVRMGNLKPSDQIALVSMDTNGGFSVIARNRDQVNAFVQAMKGNSSGQNIAVTIPYSFDGPSKESHAILIVTSPNALPDNLVGNFGSGEAWSQSFTAAAKQNGWKVDAIWFSVENKVR